MAAMRTSLAAPKVYSSAQRVARIAGVYLSASSHRRGFSTDAFQAERQRKLGLYQSKKQSPVTLTQFAFTKYSPQNILAGAQFLHSELPIRIAKRVFDLRSMPFGLANHEEVLDIIERYSKSFEELVGCPTPEDDETSALFAKTLRNLIQNNQNIVIPLARAIRDVTKETLDPKSLILLQEFVDKFITSRLGLRLLAAQHLALRVAGDSDPSTIGIVSSKCLPSDIVNQSILDAQVMCDRYFGVHPTVNTTGDLGQQFRYVPSHLRYILFELLKTSMQKVTEAHVNSGKESSPPSIKMVVGAADGEVCFKISDTGGGFPRCDLPLIWSHAYHGSDHLVLEKEEGGGNDVMDSTDIDLITGAPFGGIGISLPIARLYARYFGGDLKVFPMDGYGTDYHLYIKVLSQSNVRLPD